MGCMHMYVSEYCMSLCFYVRMHPCIYLCRYICCVHVCLYSCLRFWFLPSTFNSRKKWMKTVHAPSRMLNDQRRLCILKVCNEVINHSHWKGFFFVTSLDWKSRGVCAKPAFSPHFRVHLKSCWKSAAPIWKEVCDLYVCIHVCIYLFICTYVYFSGPGSFTFPYMGSFISRVSFSISAIIKT